MSKTRNMSIRLRHPDSRQIVDQQCCKRDLSLSQLVEWLILSQKYSKTEAYRIVKGVGK